MALETRANTSRRYYYRAVRSGDRVCKLYCGPAGSLQALVAERSLRETAEDRRHFQAYKRSLREAKRSIQWLANEARELVRASLILAGYDRHSLRRLAGRPGRPPKSGVTLRERHFERLASIPVETGHRLAAQAIDRLARLRDPYDQEFVKQLNQRVQTDASAIVGVAPLPAEQLLATAIAISRLLEMAVRRYDEVIQPKRPMGQGERRTQSLEALLDQLRRRLSRIVH